MKIRTVKYIIKEGIFNSYRNKLMSLASISIVAASLIIFGIFLLITFNLSYNIKVLNQQPEMEVFCDPDLNDADITRIEETLRQNEMVSECTKITKQEAFNKVKKILGDNSKLLEDESESFLPVSFIIKLKDPKQSIQIVEEFKKVAGVENIAYSQDMVQVISGITHLVRIISMILITVLLVISMFIISNTIKLTVFARRKEINIMKYIGATDGFIRWPFVVEGIVIGFIGAVVAFTLLGYGYTAITSKITLGLPEANISFFKIVPLEDIRFTIIWIYTLIGVVIGGIGSVISIRKYLHV
ncbi:MAG: permease-like cell division protein FtsX [Bryobacteraceae bacterium]|nr:permease-like cell division protein FtsX [Bryobacteraceae bacterium]